MHFHVSMPRKMCGCKNYSYAANFLTAHRKFLRIAQVKTTDRKCYILELFATCKKKNYRCQTMLEIKTECLRFINSTGSQSALLICDFVDLETLNLNRTHTMTSICPHLHHHLQNHLPVVKAVLSHHNRFSYSINDHNFILHVFF